MSTNTYSSVSQTVLSGHSALDFYSDLHPPLRVTLIHVEFEVFGQIEGTFFLKNVRDKCEKLGLKGWVKICSRGSVVGQIEGEKKKIDEMAIWLRLEGAPGSRIENTIFKHWKIIEKLEFRSFSVRF
ncbi:Acylphosphatase-2 [Halotydeus destructor]|nr:Acylphosphatase-2 [Halotydeus destructor]